MKTIEISYAAIRRINSALSELPDAGSVVLKHKILINSRAIEPVIKDLNKLVEPSDEFKEFQKKIKDIYLKHCETENGELVFYTDATYTEKATQVNASSHLKHLTADSKRALDIELADLNKDNEEVLTNRKKIEDDYIEHLKDLTDLTICPISCTELETIQTPDKDGKSFELTYAIQGGLFELIEM